MVILLPEKSDPTGRLYQAEDTGISLAPFGEPIVKLALAKLGGYQQYVNLCRAFTAEFLGTAIFTFIGLRVAMDVLLAKKRDSTCLTNPLYEAEDVSGISLTRLGEPIIKLALAKLGGYQRYVNLCRAFMAEFVGTAMFTFIGSLTSAHKTFGAFGHGFAIIFLAFAFGPISGAHFNPAITIGQVLCYHINWAKAIGYVMSQIVGSFVGALLLRAITNPGGCPISYSHVHPCNETGEAVSIAGGCIFPSASWSESVVCEVILTFILMQVVILCTESDTQDERDRNIMGPLAIGFTVLVNALAGAEVSGGCMNPARAFGPAVAYSVFSTHTQWHYQYIYWLGPIVGASLSALLYKFMMGSQKQRWILKV